MSRTTATLFALLLISPLTLAGEEAKEAPPLRLLPADHPAGPKVDDLANTHWICKRPRNILGAGADSLLVFHRDKDGNLLIDVTLRRWPSRPGPPTQTTNTYPCTLDGPLIRFGQQQQTIILQPGKMLVLNALVPLGKGRWYEASDQTLPSGEHRGQEILFSFADDPLKQPQGKGTIQLCTSASDHIRMNQVEFKLTREDPSGRLLEVKETDGNRGNWGPILLSPDGAFGRLLRSPGNSAKVFLPDNPSPDDGH